MVLSVRKVSGTFYRQINNPTIMASSQEVSLLLSQRLFYNAWLTTAAGRIDTGGIVLFICSTKMHEFGSKVMCETTFTATQCRALSRWVWFKMAEKNESKGDLEPAMRVIMLTVKGKLMIFLSYGNYVGVRIYQGIRMIKRSEWTNERTNERAHIRMRAYK